MNKTELLKEWQKAAEKKIPGGLGLGKHDILLETLCDVIAAELLGGGEVPLPGLGRLKVKKTVTRQGRNPRTDASLIIPAGRRVTFTAAKSLKDILKGE